MLIPITLLKCQEKNPPRRGNTMTKKKESKKTSAKEDKQVNNNIFDTNGKLILNKEQEQPVNQQIENKKKPTKAKTLSAEEAQKIKRAIWRKYYSGHKEKYKQWNKNWREKQKKKKSE
jgi:hypothetical protein